jgi:oxygen-dependent protoporphyrinogen oxidase
MTATKHVAIIGGGIAGLSAAYHLQKKSAEAGQPLSYSLFEAGAELGGKIVTDASDGFIIEGGPDSFISQKPWARDLCLELGLEDRLIGTNDAQRKTYVVQRNRLRPLPDGVMLIIPTRFLPFALSPLISLPGKLRMAMDLIIPRRKEQGDESLSSFITRRLGREALEKIAEPLMAGIYVADPYRLSLRSTFPRFLDMEQRYGSLVRAMLHQKRMRKKMMAGRKPLPLFMTLRGGLEELVQTLVSRLNGQIRTRTPVQALEKTADGFLLTTGEETVHADAVIMSAPAANARALIQPMHSELAAALSRIRYLSTATVSLAFDRSQVRHPLDGFGFVVPKTESCRLMACTIVSTKFQERAPEGKVLLRAFVGGYHNEELVDLSDDDMIDLVMNELDALLGIEGSPEKARVYRWRKANAQYDVGHAELVDRIEAMAADALPGLFFAGGAYRGVGIPDCIHHGEQAAEKCVRFLSGPED